VKLICCKCKFNKNIR